LAGFFCYLEEPLFSEDDCSFSDGEEAFFEVSDFED